MIDTNKLTRDYKQFPLRVIKRKIEDICYEDLYELYINQSLKKEEICKYFNFSDNTLKLMLRKCNIKKIENKIITKEELFNYYIVENLTIQQTADKFNVYIDTVKKYLKKYNIHKDKNSINLAREKTIQNKYKVNNVFQSDNIKEKIKKTNTQLYGKEYYQQTDEYKTKIKETKYQKYFDNNYNNLNKQQQTNLKRYGVLNASMKPDKKQYYSILRSKDLLIKFIQLNQFKSIKEISTVIGIRFNTIRKYIELYNLYNLFNYSKSNEEDELKLYISHYFKTTNNVKLLDGKEIDIYIPEKKIGIEFNGNYWHSEIYKKQKYHQNKSFLAEEKGIFLYHIFEYEWITKQDKIINQLNNLLGLNDTKIYARKCIVKEVDNKEKKQFLNLNHLQGNDNSSIKLGLYYQNELVSLMTFCKPRFNKKYEWELSRFCCKADCNVIGGASKLFKYFVSIYNPTNILSYSDIAKTRGNLYNILGFTFDHIAEPNFVWIKGNEVLSRYQCQKHKLLALGYTGSTGIEIMRERGYNRLYDAGNKVWVWNRGNL